MSAKGGAGKERPDRERENENEKRRGEKRLVDQTDSSTGREAATELVCATNEGRK